MSTSADTQGVSSCEPALPTLVNARALPAGSPVGDLGGDPDGIPISMTMARWVRDLLELT